MALRRTYPATAEWPRILRSFRLKGPAGQPVHAEMSTTSTARPFRELSASQILEAGREAYRHGDVDRLSEAISELETHRSTGKADRVSEELAELLDALEPQSGERCDRDGGETCRDCAASLHYTDRFYCATCSPPIWDRIARNVARIEKMATDPYVGRTVFPERRILQHLIENGRDRLSVLHWADSLEEAELFEKDIFKLVQNNSSQAAPRTGGGFSRGHQAIYLSWRLNGGSPQGAPPCDELLIETLPGRRLWPVPASRFQVAHLRSPLQTYQAERALERHEDREQAYLARRKAER